MNELEKIDIQLLDKNEIIEFNGGVDGTGRDSNPFGSIFDLPWPFPLPTFPW